MPPSSAYKISAVVFGLKFYKNNTTNDRTNINCFDQENLRSNSLIHVPFFILKYKIAWELNRYRHVTYKVPTNILL